ncbi:MAG: hypothetical protein LUH15_08105 [Tannerellaceae bacterium]|nr:hypothetical protein [Tannerellaceae bacterium]
MEEWLIEGNCIIPGNNSLPQIQNNKPLKLDLEKLPIHDIFLFEELLIAYNYFDVYAQTFLPQYKCLSDSTKYLIENIYNNICNHVEKDDYESSLKTSSAREELLQTTATIKALNTQAFNGINILSTNNIVRSGRDSLFGIGLCYSSVFQLYEFCRNKFSYLTFSSKELNKFLGKEKAPFTFDNIKEEDPRIPSFDEWKTEINKLASNNPSIDDLYNENKINPDSFYHLIHFSHRYGYREAKLSISLAKQCIPIGILPSWGLNTFFHELLHSHVRLLLSSLELQNATDAIKHVVQPTGFLYNHTAKDLKEFLQTAIYDCIKNFIYHDALLSSKSEKEQSQIEPTEVKEGFQYCSDLINEIMVHTLDFHYFYNSDPDLYVKSIWISWLLLSATDSRIEEYILRTVCAIGTNYLDTDYKKVFDVSLTKIEQSLLELKDYPFCKDSQINNVINYIKDIQSSKKGSRNIKQEYQNYWGKLAFVTYKFLYSKQLQSSFDYSDNAEMNSSEEYSIPLEIGEFIPVKYRNPIKIVQQNLISFFKDTENLKKEVDSVESNSIWLHSILSSTYF